MPVWHILVCNTRGHIKHDDTAMSVDIITISKSTKLLLAGCIPYIKLNAAVVLIPYEYLLKRRQLLKTHSSESERTNIHSKSCDIFLLEFACQMALYECCLGGEKLVVSSGES